LKKGGRIIENPLLWNSAAFAAQIKQTDQVSPRAPDSSARWREAPSGKSTPIFSGLRYDHEKLRRRVIAAIHAAAYRRPELAGIAREDCRLARYAVSLPFTKLAYGDNIVKKPRYAADV
jgi:hypothetical protein